MPKINFASKAALTSVAALLIASAGFAADLPSPGRTLHFEAPFAFHIGDKELPAGYYAVQWNASGPLIVNGSRGAGMVFAFTGANSPNGHVPELASVVFNKYGDTYFLSQLWYGDGSMGIQARKTRKEQEVVSSKIRVALGDVKHVTVAASLK